MSLIRRDFLEHRAISAQKYRHPLRENEGFVVFVKMAELKFNSMNCWLNIRVGNWWISKTAPEMNYA